MSCFPAAAEPASLVGSLTVAEGESWGHLEAPPVISLQEDDSDMMAGKLAKGAARSDKGHA